MIFINIYLAEPDNTFSCTYSKGLPLLCNLLLLQALNQAIRLKVSFIKCIKRAEW